MRRLNDMSDDELINICLDYADENDAFNPHFVHKMEEVIEEYDELTQGQRDGLIRIIEKWNMI